MAPFVSSIAALHLGGWQVEVRSGADIRRGILLGSLAQPIGGEMALESDTPGEREIVGRSLIQPDTSNGQIAFHEWQLRDFLRTEPGRPIVVAEGGFRETDEV